MGEPIDGLGPIDGSRTVRPVELKAPGIVQRKSVHQPCYTGLKAIDAMTPIGRGQRELIIGDRQVGKTAVGLDAILAQKDTDVHCFYVAIGQKKANVALVADTLEKVRRPGIHHDYFGHRFRARSACSSSRPTPVATMAEYYRDSGKSCADHLRRPFQTGRRVSPDVPACCAAPRDAKPFPGDVFYLHSRLLERAAKLDDSQRRRFA